MNKILSKDIEEKLSDREKILCLYKTNGCYLYNNQYIICDHYINKNNEIKNDINKNNEIKNDINKNNEIKNDKKFEFMLYL
jgi:hypothetical protein